MKYCRCRMEVRLMSRLDEPRHKSRRMSETKYVGTDRRKGGKYRRELFDGQVYSAQTICIRLQMHGLSDLCCNLARMMVVDLKTYGA